MLYLLKFPKAYVKNNKTRTQMTQILLGARNILP